MPRISLPFLKKGSRIRSLLQTYGLDRRLYEAATRFTHHSPQYVPADSMNASWEEVQHQGEPNEEDAQTLRDFYADFLRFYHRYTPQPQRIVDIGCGKWFYPLVGKYLHADYFGCDPEIGDITVTLQYSSHAFFDHGYAEKLPYPDGWADVVLLVSVLDHVKDVNRALAEANRVLRNGGIAWITLTFFKDLEHIERIYAAHHVRAFTEQSIKALIGRHFSRSRVFKGNNPNRLIYIQAFK
jgi:SAM-dependent methyltransferase